MSVARGRYSLHSHAGPLAQITNEGVTATRKNPLSDFNNAVLIGAQPLEDGRMFEVRIEEKVTSWSGSIAIGCTTSRPEAVSLPNSLSGFGQDSWILHGSALVKHGRQRINDYGRDIESLDVGDTVGIARIGRQLKFYVNGTDQGTAEDNLPPVVYPMVDLYGKCTQISIVSPDPLRGGAGAVVEGALQFHKCCGKLIKISSTGRTAKRQNAGNEYNNGVVISNRPLKDSELFEVQITDMIDKWTGSIEVGVTILQPDNMEIPATITSIQSNTWVMSGCNIVSGGKTLKDNYGISLDTLKVGDRVGVMCTESREFHVIINGSDMGPAVFDMPSNSFGIIDIYGRCTEVELVHDSIVSPRAEPATPTLVSRDHDICFSHIHGANAIISDDRKTVKRQSPDSEFTESSVFSSRPLNRNELFEVSINKLIDQWSGSLQLGVIASDPTQLDLTELEEVMDVNNDNVSVWMLSGQDLQRGGEEENDDEDDGTYDLHLDSLPEGSKVGLMVNEIGELHYYLNRQDKGCAFTGIPEGVYAAVDVYGQCVEISICHDDRVIVTDSMAARPVTASSITAVLTHQFHTKCGRNIKLTDNCTVASRVDSYNCGIVFSNGSLKNGEVFEVRLKSIEKNWSGSLLIGLTSHLPTDLLRLPEMATSLDNSWIASSTDSGKMTNVKHVIPLSKLQVGDTIGVSRHSDATMHVYINNRDLGPVCNNVSESPYAVVDVYGTSTSVSITSSPSTGDSITKSLASVLETREVTYKHGKNVSIGGLVATRRESYNCGIIVSDAPLCDDMFFQVEVLKVNTQWSGSLMIGITSMDPSHAIQLPSAIKLFTGTVVVNGKTFVVNGNERQDVQNYDLQTVKNGDRVGVVCTPSGVLLFYVNGQLKGKLLKEKIPKLRYALVDLYGCCDQVKLLPLEKAPTEREFPKKRVEVDTSKKIKKLPVDEPPLYIVTPSVSVPLPSVPTPSVVARSASSSSSFERPELFNERDTIPTTEAEEEEVLSPKLKLSSISQNCPYRQLCERFLNTLNLQEKLFERNPEYNLCYCEDCLKGRNDKKIYERGFPPKKYTLPAGWARFSLKVPPIAHAKNAFEKWHVAFHGTASKNVGKILETGFLVLPGSLVVGDMAINQPKGHYTRDNKPKGFDVDQIFVSPSIKYSGCEVYAKATEFGDIIRKMKYKCRVAFQVLIDPDSYKVGKETLGYGSKPIDTEFDNSEIEWSTKEYGTTILYGLLIKAEEVGPLVCPYRQICQRFLKTLSLPDAFFEPKADYNSCFCSSCFKDRKKWISRRGIPPRKYVRPIGWTRFSLRVPAQANAQNAFVEWHVAFHGTAPQNVRSILDKGGLVVHGASASDKSHQIIVSPSIKYTEYEKFSKCKIYKDTVTKKKYNCRVAFQVLIKPDSYTVGRETVGCGDRQVDKEFKNTEIEWSSKQIGATILYGLIIKAEEQRT